MEKKNLLCCGFGNGLVCASAILNLENTFIDKIRDFKKMEKSSGILVYRFKQGELQVLLGKCGGPAWAKLKVAKVREG